MKIEDCFYIGYITKTKGLKGEVQIFFEFDEPADLLLDSVFAEINGKLVPYFVSSYKLQNNQTGNFYFVEINTIPGQTAQSFIPQQVRAAGMNIRDFYGELIEMALERS